MPEEGFPLGSMLAKKNSISTSAPIGFELKPNVFTFRR